jgi:hypothetical protein
MEAPRALRIAGKLLARLSLSGKWRFARNLRSSGVTHHLVMKFGSASRRLVS